MQDHACVTLGDARSRPDLTMAETGEVVKKDGRALAFRQPRHMPEIQRDISALRISVQVWKGSGMSQAQSKGSAGGIRFTERK